MARTRTLAEIRTQVRRTTDQEDTEFVTDAELDVEINQAGAELWDFVTYQSPDFYLVRYELSTTTGTEEYTVGGGASNVPAGIAYLRTVSLSLGGDRWRTIEGYPQGEANHDGDYPFIVAPRSSYLTRYRFQRNGIAGDTAVLSLRPNPGTNTYRIEYVPAWTGLEADNDTFDGVNGWEDYMVQRVAVYVRQKADETEHIPIHMARLEAMKKRIIDMASNRDMGYAPQIARTRRRNRRQRAWS